MKKPYFVMLRHPNGEFLIPLTDENEEMVQFSTVDEADKGAKSSSLGSEVGYKVFHIRNGL